MGADIETRRPQDWAAIDVTAVRLLGLGGAPPIDLTRTLRFVAPDTENTEDRTVAAIPLPAGVAPGETINIAIDWTARVPRTFARTGRIGDYYFIAQWFPKIGVLEAARLERARVPRRRPSSSPTTAPTTCGSPCPAAGSSAPPGAPMARRSFRDGKATHRYRQDDVHDFAWVTSPDLVERRERFTHASLPPVDMRLLLQPEHVAQADRHFAATRAALRYYGEWFGPYPYGHITIVDPAWQSGSGGMEYPTLFTAGTRWLAPRGVTQPEGVTVHEAGHQFWYGLVANNEFEHAWLDEGLNTLLDGAGARRSVRAELLQRTLLRRFVPWVYRDIPVPRGDLRRLAVLPRGGRERRAEHAVVALLPSHRRGDHLQQDRALAAHARAHGRLAHAAADPRDRSSSAGASAIRSPRISSRSPTR